MRGGAEIGIAALGEIARSRKGRIVNRKEDRAAVFFLPDLLQRCSIAAKPLLHRAGGPTTSPGRVPISAGLQIRRRFPMPCRPKERLPMAAQMGRRTRTKL